MNEKEKYINLKAGRFDKWNRQHMYILSLCKQIGWANINPKTKLPVADTARLGHFILTTGYVKKPLKQQTPTELSKLIHQLEKVLETAVT